MARKNLPEPVLMIALDAAEPTLIEKWITDETLPNLKRLRDGGCYGRLASTAEWLAGSPWPTFYTGTTPADHGLYHFLQWRANQMSSLRPSPEWLPLKPFWRDLSEKGVRVIVIDLPMTFQPEPINGVEISGWATHDRLKPPASHPPSMMDWIRREFGPPPLSEEEYGLQSMKSLLKLRDDLIEATRRVADLAKTLMTRETWNLFLVSFGAPHRGGHKLWDLSGAMGDVKQEDLKEFSHALRDVYVSCDTAVGQLVEAAGEGVTKLVFSLHGMGSNTSRNVILPTMLDRILAKDETYSGGTKKIGSLERLRRLIPLKWRHGIKRRLPLSLQDKLTTFWRMGNIDWATTSVFSQIADLQGYIRVNLSGREAAGIVEPGEDYDRLCAEIVEGLSTFVDADTSKRIVESVVRSDQLFTQGSQLDSLPDLIVRWATNPAANHRAITSPQYGTIPWPSPGRNPDGRSGNHRPEGFLLGIGSHIQPDSRIEDATILDLAPTVMALFNVPKKGDMRGDVLPEIAG